MECGGEERAVGSKVRLGLNASEQTTVLGTRRTALFLIALVFPVSFFRVLLLDGALVDIVLAVGLNGGITLGSHVMVGASADLLLERGGLLQGWGLAHVLGERAALLQRVGLEGTGGILVGRAAESEHGLPLLAEIDLGRWGTSHEAG